MTFEGKSGVWLSRVTSQGYMGAGSSGGDRKIRILIVDDHAQYRQGLLSIFEMEPDIEPVGEASNGQDALEQSARLKPDIVLLDVNMPGMDGIEAARALADTYPDMGIIMLTMFTGEEHLRQARRAGASAYVLKDAGSQELLETIRGVMVGEMPLLHNSHDTPGSPSEGGRPAASRSDPQNRLSANERTILRLLGRGTANEDIAREVNMSDVMVRTYLEEIYRKLGLSGRDAAIRYAREHE